MVAFVRVGLFVMVLFASSAFAQCTKDTDCKGDRICSSGACIAPTVSPAPAPVVAPAPVAAPREAVNVDGYEPEWSQRGRGDGRRHGARGAATLGIISAVFTGALYLTAGVIDYAAFSSSAVWVAMPIGGTGFLLSAITAPIVGAGAYSARYFPALTGAPGARIAGWILVAVSLASGAAALITTPLGYSGAIVGAFCFLGAAVTATPGLILLAVDAGKSADDAPIAPRQRRRSELQLMPSLGFARASNGASLPTLGLSGAF